MMYQYSSNVVLLANQAFNGEAINARFNQLLAKFTEMFSGHQEKVALLHSLVANNVSDYEIYADLMDYQIVNDNDKLQFAKEHYDFTHQAKDVVVDFTAYFEKLVADKIVAPIQYAGQTFWTDRVAA